MKTSLKTIFLTLIFIQLSSVSLADVISSMEAQKFMRDSLRYSKQLYGPPDIPVKEVIIKHSNKAYTIISDEKKGVFTIYLSRKSHEYAFYGQLAHETAHLLNAKLYDVYVEGLNCVFSEKMLKREGKDWSGWAEHYRNGGDLFYASVYYMMKDVEALAGEAAMKSFLSHARAVVGNSERMYIDINGWLDTLTSYKKDKIEEVIIKHEPTIRKSMNSVVQNYEFRLPK